MLQVSPTSHSSIIGLSVIRRRPTPSSVHEVTFLFVHPRSHPDPLKNGSHRSLHIWLAGALGEYRGSGCLDTTVNVLVDLEKKRRGIRIVPDEVDSLHDSVRAPIDVDLAEGEDR